MNHDDDGTVFAGEIHFHVVDFHNADLAAAQRFPRPSASCPCSLTIWISATVSVGMDIGFVIWSKGKSRLVPLAISKEFVYACHL